MTRFGAHGIGGQADHNLNWFLSEVHMTSLSLDEETPEQVIARLQCELWNVDQ